MFQNSVWSADACAIDLQKMNWKFKAGFHEHTGVSLQARLPNTPRGGVTRVPQDTAQSCDCQRPPQASSVRLSAQCCAFSGADYSLDRPPCAPRARGGVV